MKIKQGLFRIPAPHYHSMPGLSYTGLKDFKQSPLHYITALSGQREESPAMAFGSAYHAYNLEHEDFHRDYIVMPEGLNIKSVAGQKWADKHLGFKHISANDMNQIRAMADILWLHPQWQEIHPDSEREIALVWFESDLEIWCRTRIDLINTKSNIVADLKTTQSAERSAFQASAYKFGYHIQAAWTLRGLSAVTGIDHLDFRFIAQEKKLPYAVAVFAATQGVIDQGVYEINSLLPTYAKCLHDNVWPGYDPGVQPLNIPAWVRNANNEMEDF